MMEEEMYNGVLRQKTAMLRNDLLLIFKKKNQSVNIDNGWVLEEGMCTGFLILSGQGGLHKGGGLVNVGSRLRQDRHHFRHA
jgi:hypothetical protein